MAEPAVKPWIRRTTFLILGVGAVVAYRRREQIEAFLGPLFESVNALGPWAPIVLALMYIPASLCFIPNTFLSPGVGFLLGPVQGLVVAIIGLLLGHSAAFVIARNLGRGWFYRRVPHNRRYRAVELACERDGFKIVMLTRLTPVFPSNVMSYFFGITSVSMRNFLLATAVGLLPRTIVYTTVGAAAKSFVDASGDDFQNQPLVQGALYVGVAVTIVVLVIIARIARKALNDALIQAQTTAATLPSEVAPALSKSVDEAA